MQKKLEIEKNKEIEKAKECSQKLKTDHPQSKTETKNKVDERHSAFEEIKRQSAFEKSKQQSAFEKSKHQPAFEKSKHQSAFEKSKQQSEYDSVDIYIGGRIKEKRLSMGISQQYISDQLGVSHQQFQKYEKGQNTIRNGRLREIARILKVHVSYFFEYYL